MLFSRGSGGSGTTGSLEADGSLEGIIEPPLETSEGTNHDDSGAEASPESLEADFRVDLADVLRHGSLSLDGVELGDHGISGVRNDGAEDTSQVTRQEGDSELLSLGVFSSGLGEDVGVEGFDDLFESDELHNGVGDLSSPKGSQTLVKSTSAFSSGHLVVSLEERGGESARLGGLHSDLDSFEGAQEDVSNDFCGTRSDRPTDSLVLDGVLLTNDALIDVLEDFVETEFTEALEGVTNEGGEPSESETLGT